MNQLLTISTHPKASEAASILLFCKMLLVIPFGVLVSTFALYMQHHAMSHSLSVIAAFLGCTGILRVIAGIICDRCLSHRLVFLFSAILLIVGCILLSFEHYFYWGITCIATGFAFSASINYFLAALFHLDNAKKEKAFLYNYSGMNIGYLIAFTMSGYYGLMHDYHHLFMLTSTASVLALTLIIFNWKLFSFEENKILHQPSGKYYGILTIILTLPITYQLIYSAAFNQSLFLFISILLITLMIFLILTRTEMSNKRKLLSCFILILPAVIFATIQHLMPMAMTLFVEKNVDRHYFGFILAPQWMQIINTLAIVIGGPLLCYVFKQLRNNGIHFNDSLQLTSGLIFTGLSLLIITMGISMSERLISFNWIIASSITLGFAELLIIPIGLAMVSKLIPADTRGIMMGSWLLLLNISAVFSSFLSQQIISFSR
jgi:POT family proton-dependent oligopeptide transporter